MKVFICIPQLIKGGAERVVNNISNYLASNNIVTVISLTKNKVEYAFDNKVKIEYLDNSLTDSKITKLLNRIKKLKKMINNDKPDVVLCFLPPASFLTLFLKKIHMIGNTNVVVSVRNDPKSEYNTFIKRFLMKILYKKATGFVFQTKEAQDYFPKNIREKSTIIMNSINPEFIINKEFNGTRKKEIVSVGRLTEQKNHLLLIKAFEKVVKENPKYKLIIYGDGPKRKELEEYIKGHNLEDKVFLPGVVDNVKEKIYDASIFVLSSNYEGMPNALLEAMCLGVPCISTNCPCGGPKELINDGYNGFLVEVNNIDDLASKINYVLLNEDKMQCISTNALELSKKVNPNIINKQWENYLKKIVLKKIRIKKR